MRKAFCENCAFSHALVPLSLILLSACGYTGPQIPPLLIGLCRSAEFRDVVLRRRAELSTDSLCRFLRVTPDERAAYFGQ